MLSFSYGVLSACVRTQCKFLVSNSLGVREHSWGSHAEKVEALHPSSEDNH